MPATSLDTLRPERAITISYADVTTAIGVDTTATPDTNVAIASANLNSRVTGTSATPVNFTFDPATGTLTLNCSGNYWVDVDCLFAATLAAGAVQTMKILQGSTGALVVPTDMQTFREEGTATQKAQLSFNGGVGYLTDGTIMQLAFSSDTANDDALVFALTWSVTLLDKVPGTAA